MKIRLNKFLSLAGIGSRRGVEKFIERGEILINGKVVREPYISVDTEKDTVSYKGKVLYLPPKKYLIFNKPRNVLSTMKGGKTTKDVKTLYDFVRDYPVRVFPVGRLDKDTTGLMIFTNDGELANRLMKPKWKVEKEYMVLVSRLLDKKEEKIFRDGVYIKDDGDYKTLPAKINFIRKEKGYFLYRVIIVEGKKRQIKKMFAFFGIKVIELKRVRIGPIKLGKLEVGKYRELTDYEVDRLKESVGLV